MLRWTGMRLFATGVLLPLAISYCGPITARQPSALSSLSRVYASPQGLQEGGNQPFYLSGANQYYLFYKNSQMVDDVFAAAQSLGLNTMRTWAFCEGQAHEGVCLQPAAGVYDEAAFRKLDYVIKKARDSGVRLVLTLSNNWTDFGGIDQYLRWVGGGLVHDDFYRDERLRTLFRKYIRQVLNRVNSLTGVAYKDDPTIMIWELMNEPRADDKQSLYAWIDEMAAYIKSLDSLHLVSTGSEGGFSTDFIATHASPHIDVASLHLYVESWNISIEAATSMLREHLVMAREQLKKPLYLGEFGILDQTKRADAYRQWYDLIDHENGKGALLWVLSGTQYDQFGNKGQRYPDYDGYTVYYPESTNVVPLIKDFSVKMRAKPRVASAKADR